MSQVKFRSTLFKGLRGRWCPVGTVQRLTEPAGEKGQSPTALTLWGVSLKKARETAKRLSRPVAPRPLSHGCRRASVSAAASVGRWATSHRDVAAPKGEPSRQLTRGLQKAKSRLPLWGRCPRRGRRGQSLARGPAFGKPPSWHSAVRERRGKAPVSLAFFHALRACKVKGKVAAF